VTYLYLYEGADRRLYIGIGDEMTRPWEAHNEDAQALLAEPTTQLLQTPEPFSSRKDASRSFRDKLILSVFLLVSGCSGAGWAYYPPQRLGA